MLKILIVEDDSQLAVTLKYLVEDNPRYRVVAMAEDADGAIAAAEEHRARPRPARPSSRPRHDRLLGRGAPQRLGVPCLFVSGKAPRFPMPDLALGCLMKPFTAEDVHRSLAAAEDLLRGRETLRPKLPDNLTLYEPHEECRRRNPASSRRSRRCGRGSSIGFRATSTQRLEPHHSPCAVRAAPIVSRSAARRRRAAPGAGP